ncbi:MAG TPA: hypothetical protein VMH86_11845 [Rhizomicrobium sp.]|nr:hypothetical protein [Rhizomicrobium sp.]
MSLARNPLTDAGPRTALPFPLPDGAPLERGTVDPRMLEPIVRQLIERDPLNMRLKTCWISLQFALALLDSRSGRHGRAERRLHGASKSLNELLNLDPDNPVLLKQQDYLDSRMLQSAPASA